MSGSDVPYHLRPNKFVERQIFIEILERIDKWKDLDKYLYISMGGRYLEDLKLIHTRFGINNLFSIEQDPITLQRQLFNKPIGLIKCRQLSSAELIKEFDNLLSEFNADNCIVWLDYADASKRQTQLREFETLITKLKANDVVKITLNASLKTLADENEFDSTEEFQKHALEKIKNKLGDYFPNSYIEHKQMTSSGLADLLSQSVKKAALNGLRGSPDLKFYPLAQLKYNDAFHSMFTLTAIILKEEESDEFNRRTNIKSYDFHTPSWHDIYEISVPDLSLKEKFAIDEILFSVTDDIMHERLPFRFNKDNSKSLDILRNYIKHYKRYPNFVRAFI